MIDKLDNKHHTPTIDLTWFDSMDAFLAVKGLLVKRGASRCRPLPCQSQRPHQDNMDFYRSEGVIAGNRAPSLLLNRLNVAP
jgi:hypothetical protein